MPLFGRQSASSRTLTRMNEARRRGDGVKLQDWQIEDFDPDQPHGLVENVVDWCRRTVAESRRPYGINSFDLTLAFRVGEDNKIRSVNFQRLQPMELYDDSFAARLLETLGIHIGSPAPLRISAGLFSWGDAAHQALGGEAR
jgi:hypothetical protein